MNRIPDAEQTPQGPAYEGRLLDRPDEEVVDQGAPFDVRTLITRRGILGLVGVGLGTVALAACAPVSSASTARPTSTPASTPSSSPTGGSSTGSLPSGEIPDETAGPYPGDGSNGPDVLEQTGIVRSDLRTSIGSSTTIEGVPLTFTLTVTDMADGDAPFAGAAVYAWHCDAQGRYSMYSQGVEGETWLRGVQVADANGQVTFTSIVPGCYTGRWPHIHFEVYPSIDDITDATNAVATSQLAYPEAPLADVYALSAYDGSARNLSQVSLSRDNVFGGDGGALQLATVTGDTSGGHTATLTVRVDTTTPSAGQAPGGRR
jgi:protocatechuate 3,4-dioxygenase beta subunit